MPVSRKRKKKPRKSRASTRLPTGTAQSDSAAWPAAAEIGNVLSALVAKRQEHEAYRTSLVEETADALVAELVEAAAGGSDSELEDRLCQRLGARMRELAEGSFEDHVGPDEVVKAAVTAAGAAVEDALGELDTEPEGWRAPWRVLTTLARTLPHPLGHTAADEIEDLYTDPGGHVLPKTLHGPAVVGQVLWTRDAYGSRRGVTA